jgi:large conductance mechanosensitive channel
MSMLSESEARAKAGAQFATGTGRRWLGEFEVFILRGNVIDLAIGVVIGVAFGAVVTGFVNDFINPLLAVFGGRPKLDWSIRLINSHILVGDFVSILLNFLIIAAVIFFFVIKPVNVLMDLRKTEKSVQKTTRDCPYCLSSIPIQATRCAFCTQAVPAMVAVTADAKVEA